VHDVIRTLRRRYPVAELLIAGVAVEGDGAPSAIGEGVAAVDAAGVDVILLVRGGGSYEDLMPFNAECVARAVAAASVPVVTGIGHEPDTSIADMVADVRASTPTAAAEAVAPSLAELDAHLDRERRLLCQALQHRVQGAAHRVLRLAERPVLRDPRAVLGPAQQALDEAAMALARALPRRLERDGVQLARGREALRSVGHRLLDRSASQVALAAARLHDLSPVAVLSRGYAICWDGEGKVVHTSEQVAVGDRIGVRLGEGQLGCRVEEILEG
jgi:exodeoxyribonuclease VII large subunit